MLQLKNFLLPFIIFCGLYLQAQVPVYIHYEIGNGIPSNELYDVVQDSKGFLWIGSEAGLIRYNGSEFKLYTNKKLLGASITDIVEDVYGNIWCHNFSGQILFVKDDTLRVYEPWNKYYKNQLVEIVVHENKLIVSNYKNHIYAFNLTNNKVEKLLDDSTIKQSISISHTGKLIFSALENGKVFQLLNNKIVSIPLIKNEISEAPKKIYNSFLLFPSAKNKRTLGLQRQSPADEFPSLFIYQNNELIVHPITQLLRKLNTYPITVFDDDEGNLFIGTYKGCYWFVQKNGIWKLESSFFENEAVSSITKDKEGSYWFTTLKNGLYQIPNLQVKFFTESQLGIALSNLSLIASDKRNTLFVSSNGKELLCINTETNRVTQQINTNEERDAQAMIYNSTTNQLYFHKNSFFVYDKSKLINYKFLISAPKNFYLRNDGILFSAGVTIQSTFLKNATTKYKLNQEFNFIEELPFVDIVEKMNPYPFDKVTISNQRARCIWYNEKEKILWCGFSNGTRFFDQKIEYNFIDSATKMPVVSTCFQQLENGTLCIGTIEQGIYFVKNKKIIKQYTIQNGLLSNRIKKMIPYKNMLWFISSKGIQGLNIYTGIFNNFTSSNGLLSDEIFDIEILNNKVYLSTAKGLQYFPTTIVTKTNVIPGIVLKNFKVNDSSYQLNSSIQIPYNSTNLSFELLGITLKSKNSFVYEYRLLGIDTNWIKQNSSNNLVRFASLPSGEYTFECRVENEVGVKSKIIQQKFTVLNPWWSKWWFLLALIIITLSLVYIYLQKKIETIAKKNNENLEKAKVQEALRNSQLIALKAQMNPHFMFNALNSIQEFIVLNNKRQANFYLGKFADLMRLTLDLSSKEIITLDDELKTLNLYLELEALRFEENFYYTITTQKITDVLSIKIPAMLIQPYIENAVKHGLLHKQGNKKLTVSFLLLNEQTLVCTIEDNGIGRKRSEEMNSLRKKRYTSFATGATQKRLELLNYGRSNSIAVHFEDLYDAFGNANGTKVSVQIPIYKQTFGNS